MDIRNIFKKYRWLVVIITLVITVPIIFLVAEKFLVPAQSWFDDAWEFRKAITITNSGSLGYEGNVELVVDTASLIAANKIQSDCDDIRFIDHDDSSPLLYWIESGCNTSSTVIWVRVYLYDTEQTMFMYYGNGSATAASQSWTGNMIFLADNSCPATTTRVSDMDGKFIYGDSGNYGLTGGSSSHTHANLSCTTSNISDAAVTVGNTGGGTVPSYSHTHTNLSTGTISTATNVLPPYKDVILCAKPSYSSVPSGLISIFKDSIPSGWTRFSALDNYLLRANSTYGSTGGSATHTHTYPGGGSTGADTAPAVGETFLLFDKFSTNVSAGSINGTAPDPFGSGSSPTRTVLDSNNKLSISGGLLNFATGGVGAGNPGVWYGLLTRTAGRTLMTSITTQNTTSKIYFGTDNDISGAPSDGFLFNSDGNIYIVYSTSSQVLVGSYTSSTTYQLAVVVKSSGQYYFIKGGSYTNWTLLYTSGSGSTQPTIVAGSSTTSFTADDFRISNSLWLPTPIAYDPFTRSNGAAGSTPTSGPDGQTTPSLAWTGGTVSSNQLVITPTTGSELLTNTGMEAPYTGGVANGWSLVGAATPSENTSDKHGGTSSQQLTNSSGSTAAISQSVTIANNTWYSASGWLRRASGSSSAFLKFGNGVVASVNVNSFNLVRTISRSSSCCSGSLDLYGGNVADVLRFDDISLKALDTASLFATVPTTESDVIAEVNINSSNPTGVPSGLVVNLDSASNPQNFVIAYHDGVNVHLDKAVGGVYTSLINTAVSYSPSATIKIIKEGTKYRVLYAGAAVGTEQTISDAGIINNTIHGVFSTSSTISLDNFTLWKRSNHSLPDNTDGSIIARNTHFHDAASGSTDAGNNIPPYLNVLLGKADSTTVIDQNMVGMFDVIPPLGWTYFSPLNGRFPMGSDTYGATGGSATHTHNVNLASTAPLISIFALGTSGVSSASPTHTHSCSVTSASASNLPPYSTVIFATRINNSVDGVSYSMGGETKNTPTTPSSTGATALSTNSIRWNFIDNSGNEAGFKIYTTTDVQQVDCPGVDISYCDESGLSPNTSYARKVLAYNNHGDSDFSDVVTRATLMPVPDVSLGTITASSVGLTADGLTNLNQGSSGVYFDCVDSGCDTGLNSWQQTATAIASGLSPNTTYNFTAKARNSEATETSYSSNVQATTLANTPSIILGGTLSDTKSPGTLVNDTSSGLSSWSLPTRAASSNDQYARFTNIDGIIPYTSQYLKTTNFGFAIPGGATITGVSVDIERRSSELGTGKDYVIKLVKGGTITGDNKADTSIFWPITDTYKTYGSSSDLWGIALTPTDVNASDFGVVLQAQDPDDFESSNWVDHIQMTVYYNTGSAITSSTIDLQSSNTNNLTNGSSGVYFDCLDSGCDTGLNTWVQTVNSTATGLSPNTQYRFNVKARNANSVETATSSTLTLYSGANIPGTPTGTGLQSTSSLNVKVATNSNPISTEFALYEETTAKYVNSTTGALQASADWATYAQWGGVNGVDVVGLTSGTQYTFKVKARNNDSVETSFSGSVNLSTLLSTPTLSHSATTSSSITWSISSVAGATSYELYDNSNNLIQTCGTTSCLETGLSSNAQYTRKVKAKNSISNSDYSSTHSVYTSTAAAVINSVTTDTDSAIINWTSNNPASTEFSIHETVSDKYLNPSNGLLVDTIVWGTYTDFNNISSEVLGLSPYTHLSLVITSRNNDNIVSGTSNTISIYTKANVPEELLITNIGDTSVQFALDPGSDPVAAQYLVYVQELDKYYNHSNGSLVSSPTGLFTTATNLTSINITGLTQNTSYHVKVKARNQDLVETAFNSGTYAFTVGQPVTTHASVPGKIDVLSAPTPTSLQIRLNDGGNPSTVRFAVRANTTGLFVNHSTLALQSSADYATYAEWGGSNGVVVQNLSINTKYEFVAIAINNVNAQTSQSSTFDSTYTLANTPGVPTVNRVSSSSVSVVLDTNGNPAVTQYAIHIVELNKFVNSSTYALQDTVSWATASAWPSAGGGTITISGLTTGDYTFEVKARNQNLVETAYSSNNVSVTLSAPTIGTPVLVDDMVNGGHYSSVIRWVFTDNESNEVGYRVFDTNGVQVAQCEAATSYCDETGLTPNTSYTRKIAAYDANGIGLFSGDATKVTPAAMPSIQSLTALSSSSVRINLNSASNPGSTQFQVQNFGGLYVNPTNGLLQSSAVWGTYSQFGGSSGLVVTGLSADSLYRFRVRAQNSDDIATNFTSFLPIYTFANVPGMVSVQDPTTNSFTLTLNPNGNPSATTFAIRSRVNGLYLNHSNNDFQASPDWATYAQWGSLTGRDLSALDPNSKYELVATARNQDEEITAESSTYDSMYTLANTPSAPTVAQITSTSIRVTVNTNGNPTYTKYVIFLDELNKYVNHTTLALQSSPDWATYSEWNSSTGVVVGGLTSGSTHTVKVKARNQDLIETSYNSSNVSVNLVAPQIGTPEVLSSSSVRWKFEESETDEVGVRIYDENDVQVAQCVGTNLTFCDETGLIPNTSYTRKLALYDVNGHGVFSNSTNAITFAAVPSILSLTAGTGPAFNVADGVHAINLKMNVNSNPSDTEFLIQETVSGNYVTPNGLLVSGEQWYHYLDFDGSNGVNVNPLFANANYTFKIKARNSQGVETDFSPEVSRYTLAVRPGNVATAVTGTTTMHIDIDNGGNTPATLIAVKANASGLYLNHTTRVLQASADWATYADFGGDSGVDVINLDPNQKYEFVTIAKNNEEVLTAQSSSYSSSYTFANVPSESIITRINGTSVRIRLQTNGNPSNTKYRVYLEEMDKYVDFNNGTLVDSQSPPVWGTLAEWGGSSGLVVTGVNNSTNTFKVKARNQDLVETAYNSVSIFVEFDAPTIGTPEIRDSSTIRWNFVDNSTGEVGYRVFDESNVQVSQCTGGTLTYCDEYGLTPNTSYTRKIAAYNQDGIGLFSNTATIVTTAVVPTFNSVTADSTTSVLVKINKLTNPSSTEFEVQETVSGYYVNPANGELVSGEVWGTYAQFGGDDGKRITGLFANALYTFKVRARNRSAVSTSFSDPISKYTLVVAPGRPTVVSDAPTSVVVTVDNGGNTYNTEFAIKETLSGKYVNTGSSSLITSPTWFKISDLTNSSVRVSGLTANTRYIFTVIARNGDNLMVSAGSDVTIYTLANIPNALNMSQIDARNVRLRMGEIRNPSATQYAVIDKSTNNFVNLSNGSLQANEVWGSATDISSSDGLTVRGLVPGKKYEFSVRARNGDSVVTGYSNSSFIYTYPAIGSISSANAVTTKALNVKINRQGNDDSVQYAVHEENVQKYVDIVTGLFVDNPSWGTYTSWGGDSGLVVVGLVPSKDYAFRVNAKNSIDQESGLSGRTGVGTNAILINVPNGIAVGLSANRNVNPTTLAGSQRGLQKILTQINSFRVADIPILFTTDRDWSRVIINSIPSESKAVIKVHEEEGFSGKYTMYVVKNDSNRFVLCTKAEKIEDVNINCDGSIVFVGPFPQTIEVNGSPVSVSIAIFDGVQYWVVDGLSGTGGLGVKVEEDGTVVEPGDGTDEEEEGSGGTGGNSNGGSSNGNGGSQSSGNIVQQSTANVARTVNNVVKGVQAVPEQTTKAIKGISTALDNTVGTLPEEQLTAVTTTASVATVTVGLASLSGSLSSLPYYLLELALGFLSFLGFRKAGKPYGFVYDAVTKEPISRAVVRVYNSKDKLMWTDVTDVFGTFNAKLERGKYKILVQKGGYKFPTQIISGLSDYPLEPVYHGELVNLDSKKLFNVMIPIDPSGVNKFIKLSVRTRNIIESIVKNLNIVIFLAGLILAIYTYNRYPNPLNLLFISVYIPTTILILRNLLLTRKEWGKVVDKRGKPVAGVEVVLKDMAYGRYVGKRVTEQDGLYRFVVSKGSYELLLVSDDYKVIKYEGGSNVIQISKNDNEVVAKNIIVAKKKSK